MENKKKGLLVILMFIIALIVGFVVWRWVLVEDSYVHEFKKKEVIRIAVAKAFITAPVLLALHKGYFRDEGLNVVVTGEFSSGKGSFESMLAG